MNEKIFREYDIRGIADTDLNQETVTSIGNALGVYFKEHSVRTMTIGRDCRLSSPRIFEALSTQIQKAGIEIIDIGLVPTPLLYFSVFHLKVDAGIMITGSHNPAEQNGFKIALGKSTIYGEEIQKVKRLAKEGKKVAGVETKIATRDVKDAYVDYVVKNIHHPLNLKVAVDSGNGMGGMIAPELYRKLGCEVVELFSEPDGRFPNHHPDPTVLENLEDLQKQLTKGNFVCGIGFDGDADRIGVMDPTGEIIFGDELLVIYSRALLKKHPGACIISEVKASNRLFNDIEKHGGRPILWKTGHSLIKAKMKESEALLAGEMSGHMFFNDRYFGYDDAIYAGARLLEILHEEKKTPKELLKDLPPAISTPEIRKDCSDESKFEVVEKAKMALKAKGYKVNDIDGVRLEFEDGWGLVRASNTQPVLVYRFEATSEKRLSEIRQLLESTVEAALAKK